MTAHGAEDKPMRGGVSEASPSTSSPSEAKGTEQHHDESLYKKSLRKFRRDKFGIFGLSVVGLYGLAALGVWLGFFCTLDASTTVIGPQHMKPGQHFTWTEGKGEAVTKTVARKTLWGTDIQGYDVFIRLIYSVKQAFAIGILVSFFSVLAGVILGTISGYFPGKIDDFLLWVYTSFSSVPGILWIISISYAFGKGFLGVIIALSATFWLGAYFSIRAEVRRLKEMEFVLASESFGMPQWQIIVYDVIPNLSHLIFIFLSLNFIAAIKTEVILSFLGLGIASEPSWGLMISNSRTDLLAGKWWEVTGATILLFILVMSFNLFTDALQDAFDPKKVG